MKILNKLLRYHLKSASVSTRASALASTIRDGPWHRFNKCYKLSETQMACSYGNENENN